MFKFLVVTVGTVVIILMHSLHGLFTGYLNKKEGIIFGKL